MKIFSVLRFLWESWMFLPIVTSAYKYQHWSITLNQVALIPKYLWTLSKQICPYLWLLDISNTHSSENRLPETMVNASILSPALETHHSLSSSFLKFYFWQIYWGKVCITYNSALLTYILNFPIQILDAGLYSSTDSRKYWSHFV